MLNLIKNFITWEEILQLKKNNNNHKKRKIETIIILYFLYHYRYFSKIKK